MLAGLTRRLPRACLALWFVATALSQTGPATPARASASSIGQETLIYSVEWRLITAGSARLSWIPIDPPGENLWKVKLHLESSGLVSKLYRVDDNYEASMNEHFCADRTQLDAAERNRHRETNVEFDRSHGKANYVERDLVNNTTLKTAQIDIPACVSDIMGGLYQLRTMKLEPGQSDQLVLSDGKKVAYARVEAQARETIKTKAGNFNTIRYEAHIFNGVLYTRKARFQIWMSDDARRLPVQLRARMSFPIGSITLQLDNVERATDEALRKH